MLSFWERESLLHYHIAIVGGGIVGLSTAAALAERFPEKSIVVLERSLLPYGASTRNAGFACFGSLTELLADADTMGWDATAQLVADRHRGLRITRQRLGDTAVGFEPNGGYELLSGDALSALHHLDTLNAAMRDIFNEDYLSECPGLIADNGFDAQAFATAVSMAGEGQVDTGCLMRALERYVGEKGVTVRTGAAVQHWEEGPAAVTLNLSDAHRGAVALQADQMVVCTNAFAPALLPEVRTTPGRGQVLVTHPIPGLPWKGNYHIEAGYYYLRNVGNRVMFGGGRHLDFEGETSDAMALHAGIQQRLEDDLRLFLPNTDFSIDLRWAGIMSFGAGKTPIVQRLTDRTSCAIKMSGMGVALAGTIGEKMTEIIADA